MAFQDYSRAELIKKVGRKRIWVTAQQNDLRAQRRLGSACASTQSDQSSLCAQWEAKNLRFLYADSEDSDQAWVDAMAYLSPCWVDRSFCMFCLAAAHFGKKSPDHLQKEHTSSFLACGPSGPLIYSIEEPSNWTGAWQTNKMKIQISPGIRPVRSVFVQCALYGKLRTQCFFMQTVKTQIKLVGCRGWSESLLGAQVILYVLSCCGSFRKETTWPSPRRTYQ